MLPSLQEQSARAKQGTSSVDYAQASKMPVCRRTIVFACSPSMTYASQTIVHLSTAPLWQAGNKHTERYMILLHRY